MNLWDARFTKKSDQKLNDFNSSIDIDSLMYKQDIEGSIAHVTMLGKQNIISLEDAALLQTTLKEILTDIESGRLEIDMQAEDIHMFVETELTKRIEDVGKRLHTARSRNDQVALDFRMYAMAANDELCLLLEKFIKTLCSKAKNNLETIMPGYTHLQRAQPITFAHHLMAYVEMFKRDLERLKQTASRTNVSPLGSGALATTTYPIDRELTKELLGFKSISLNSLDGVSDRDFAIELASDISLTMMHLSRLSEEIIMWCSWEFKFIELDDSFATGSSIMPQKKNPDICELVRGKSGRVFGNLQSLLVMMKGLPLAYNKDMQEDKAALFDSIDTLKLCLETMIPLIDTCKVLENNMYQAASKGFLNATDCADYLTKKGLPFRSAYEIVGKLVQYSMETDKTLEELTLEEYKEMSPKFENDIYEAIDLINIVNKRDVIGGPSPKTVKRHIETVMKELKVKS